MAGVLHRFLHHPGRVALLCLALLTGSLVIDGLFWRLWSLDRDQVRIDGRIEHLRVEIARLDTNLVRAKDPSFIEKEARDRLDLADERDLLFVFPDE